MNVIKEAVVYRDDMTYWVKSQHDDDTRTILTYNEAGELVSQEPYPAEDLAEAEERAAAVTQETNRAALREQALGALQTNRDFLANSAPTNAQVLAQVRALTRQNIGIIRLAANALEGTD